MKLRIGIVLPLVAGLACGVQSQDGGKIGWKGKEENDDIKALMAHAKEDGKAIMMFFTSEG